MASLSLGSNINALKTLRALSIQSFSLNKSFERLSSGLRINRASDDPAGLSVASILASKSRVLNRAALNVSDGISLLNIADGAVSQVSELLFRMKELAEQSANGTYSFDQRLNIDSEYTALDQEISRIIFGTKFNGQQLLTGKVSSGTFSNLGKTVDDPANPSAVSNISGDGKYFAYAYQRKIYLIDLYSGDQTVIDPQIGSHNEIFQILLTGTGDIIYSKAPSIIPGEQTGPADLFFYDVSTGSKTQLTNSQDISDLSFISVSSDGRKVAFSSNTHYVIGGTLSNGTSLGNQRVFVVDLNTGVFSGVEQDVTDLRQLSISSDGRYVALKSRSDLAGNNSDGNGEMFLYKVGESSYTQLTDTTSSANLELVGISNSGKVIVRSKRSELTGDSSGVSQFYEISTDASIRQLTHLTAEISEKGMRLSVDGSRIFFASTTQLTSEQTNGAYQIYRLDTLNGDLTQLTSFSSDPSSSPTYFISPDGSTVVAQGDDGINISYDAARITPSSKSFDFEAGFGSAGNIIADLQSVFAQVRGLGGFTLTSQENAKYAVELIDENINRIAELRGKIGASMSRLEKALNVIKAQAEEGTAARGRIENADIAFETASLLRRQISQQAAVAVLAQANIQPSLALTLL